MSDLKLGSMFILPNDLDFDLKLKFVVLKMHCLYKIL